MFWNAPILHETRAWVTVYRIQMSTATCFLHDMSSVQSFSRLSCHCLVGVKFLSLAVGACSLEPRDESFVTETLPVCTPKAALVDLKKLATS